MEEQHSQKRGLRSEAQKLDRARDGYEAIPPSNPVAGAFGERKRETPTDQDLALSVDERNRKQGQEPNQE